MSPMSRGFVAKLEGFVAQHGIPLVQFRKGERKDQVMAEHLRHFAHEEGVVFVGKAQEKTPVFRTEKRRSPTTGRPYPWIVRSTAMVNHYYVYAVDRDFGPFFSRPPPGSTADLQSQDRSHHAGPVPHPDRDKGRDPVPERLLQEHADQAVPQREPCLAH